MSTNLKPLHDPGQGPLLVVGLMSGTGSNLRRVLERERELEKKRRKLIYKVVAIFSDSFNSKASEIGKDFDLPVIIRDLRGFYHYRGKPLSDLSLRESFDLETIKALSPFMAKVAVYAGYMSIATKPLVEAYLGVNVHPADLSIEVEGKRKYTGAYAVRDAILSGEKFLRSTTHIIESVVDQGRLLMVSPPLEVTLDNLFEPDHKEVVQSVARSHQERLKEAGDWLILPLTIQFIAEGRYAEDEHGHLFFDGQPIPYGYRLEVS